MAHPILTRAATADLDEALTWYRERDPRLVARFLDDFASVLRRIESRPHQFVEVAAQVRRAHMTRFPYALFFTEDGPEVPILAVLHHRRRPRGWP